MTSAALTPMRWARSRPVTTSSIFRFRLLALGGTVEGAFFSRTGRPPLLFAARPGWNCRTTTSGAGAAPSAFFASASGSARTSWMIVCLRTAFCTFFSWGLVFFHFFSFSFRTSSGLGGAAGFSITRTAGSGIGGSMIGSATFSGGAPAGTSAAATGSTTTGGGVSSTTGGGAGGSSGGASGAGGGVGTPRRRTTFWERRSSTPSERVSVVVRGGGGGGAGFRKWALTRSIISPSRLLDADFPLTPIRSRKTRTSLLVSIPSSLARSRTRTLSIHSPLVQLLANTLAFERRCIRSSFVALVRRTLPVRLHSCASLARRIDAPPTQQQAASRGTPRILPGASMRQVICETLHSRFLPARPRCGQAVRQFLACGTHLPTGPALRRSYPRREPIDALPDGAEVDPPALQLALGVGRPAHPRFPRDPEQSALFPDGAALHAGALRPGCATPSGGHSPPSPRQPRPPLPPPPYLPVEGLRRDPRPSRPPQSPEGLRRARPRSPTPTRRQPRRGLRLRAAGPPRACLPASS